MTATNPPCVSVKNFHAKFADVIPAHSRTRAARREMKKNYPRKYRNDLHDTSPLTG